MVILLLWILKISRINELLYSILIFNHIKILELAIFIDIHIYSIVNHIQILQLAMEHLDIIHWIILVHAIFEKLTLYDVILIKLQLKLTWCIIWIIQVDYLRVTEGPNLGNGLFSPLIIFRYLRNLIENITAFMLVMVIFILIFFNYISQQLDFIFWFLILQLKVFHECFLWLLRRRRTIW